MVVSTGNAKSARPPSRPGTTASASPIHRIAFIAWLVPAGIIGTYLYMWSNPEAITAWMSPYAATTRKSWRISTPADIELLIGKAQAGADSPSLTADQGEIRDIIGTLKSHGVRLLISDHVTPQAGGEWDSRRGEIRLRPSTVSMGTFVLLQALAHEAAHVAQSCRAGGLRKKSEPMGIPVDPVKTYQQQLDSALYKGPMADKAIELEAFTVGATPSWAPKLLDHFCGA